MFHDDRATAVAVFFLQKAPQRRLNDLKLMKLMVIAERRSMAAMTALITGAGFASMQNGPVLSEVLDLFQGRRPSDIWNGAIRLEPHRGKGSRSNELVLTGELDVADYLSPVEIDLLESVWQEWGHKDKWELVSLTHEFPEWDRTVQESRSSRPISLEKVFHLGLGEPPETARERAQEIEYFEKVIA